MNKHLLTSAIAINAAAFMSDQAAPLAPAPAAKVKADRVAPVLTAVFKLPGGIPEKAKVARGSTSPYAFDKLEIGEAFGVKNKDAHQMSSIVSNKNRSKGNQVAKKDAAGNTVFVMKELKDANGNSAGSVPTSEAETVAVKEWRAVNVDAEIKKSLKGTPLEGSTVLVFRIS